MDLDLEELEATRKLNGVAKDSNIEIIEDFINEIKDFELNKDTVEIVNALEDILAERKQDKARIQELEEALLKVKDKNVKLFIHYKNSISKQKVKEGLEDIEDYFDRLNGPDEDTEYIRNVKKELLEEK